MQLTSLYNNINQQGMTAIRNHQEQLDRNLLNPDKDMRRGLTLTASLPAHVSRNIMFCLQNWLQLNLTNTSILLLTCILRLLTLLQLAQTFCSQHLKRKNIKRSRADYFTNWTDSLAFSRNDH